MGRKRGSGEGTIRHLPSGRWVWITMDGYKDDGKTNYVRVHADTKKELLEEVENYKMKRSLSPAKKIPSFREFSEMWFSRHKESLRVSSQNSYTYTLTKLQMYWENTPIDEVTASAVYDMLAHFDKVEKLSSSYVKKLRTMCFQVFQAAEADNLVAKNPVRYVKYKLDKEIVYAEKTSSKKDSFTDAEIRMVVECEEKSKWQDAFLLLLGSGLRVQELLTLRGSNIDETGMYIEVHDAVNMNGGVAEIGKTKSSHSIRTIPIPASLQHITEKWRHYDEHLIFESPKKKGKPLNPNTFRKGFKAFCEKVGIRSLTPHCTRHTYVTKLREHGVDQEVVKALVGHARTGVTEGYNHISMKTLELEVKKISHLYEKKSADKHST